MAPFSSLECVLRPERDEDSPHWCARERVQSTRSLGYEYDDEGNRTRKYDSSSEVLYGWDHRNRLVSVTFRDLPGETVTKTVTYEYDVNNRRVSKTVDDTVNTETEHYVWDNDHHTLTLDDSGDAQQINLYGDAVDLLFATETDSGDVFWSLADNQNTVRDVVQYDDVNDETDVVAHRKYDIWGNLISETNPQTGPVPENIPAGYTGREWDADAELSYYRARWYDPVVGRFVSEDPIGFEAGDANVQRYVGNQVPNAVDPSGLKKKLPTKVFWANAVDRVESNGLPPHLIRFCREHSVDVFLDPSDGTHWDAFWNDMVLQDTFLVKWINNPKGSLTSLGSPSVTTLYNEAFHVWWDFEGEKKREYNRLRQLLSRQTQYSSDRIEKAEEAMSELISFLISEIVDANRTGRPFRPPTYKAALGQRRWKMNMVPGHDGPNEKWQGDSEAQLPISGDLYYATLLILLNPRRLYQQKFGVREWVRMPGHGCYEEFPSTNQVRHWFGVKFIPDYDRLRFHDPVRGQRFENGGEW